MPRIPTSSYILPLLLLSTLARADSKPTTAPPTVLDVLFQAEHLIETVDEDWRLRTSQAQFALRKGHAAEAIQATLRTTRQALTTLPFFDSPVLSFKPTPILTEKPVPGQLSSPFGYRRDPIRRRRKHHKGVDFVAKRNTPIHAAGPGVVAYAGRRGGYGRMVIIDHGLGLETRYAHLQRINVKKGEFVPRGATVGKVGSSGRATGPHLHFEVRQDGIAIPPAKALDVELPGCSKNARDCRRRRRQPQS
jgi:murein DD-endopeptidase MepM/ murein hydrolase activator NlpD